MATRDGDKIIRIGGAAASMADTALSVPQLLGGGRLDYLIFDYLAEGSMAISARMQAVDAAAGFGTDSLKVHIGPYLKTIAEQGVRVIANAGGVNPAALAAALRAMIAEQGLNLTVAYIEGDDLRPQLSALREAGVVDWDSGAAFPDAVISANAYLGAFPIAAALDAGADIVITGRIVDSALALGPLIHEFGWGTEDYDLLAAGTLAGHLLECGAQVTGGTFTDWRDVPDWANIGYPIGECHADGSVVITKIDGTGGLVSIGTVAEQILYEVSDPADYIVAHVRCDFGQVKLEQIASNRVRVTGARGRAPTDSYKVCVTFDCGWRAVAYQPIIGEDAAEKAMRQCEALFARARQLLAAANLPDFTLTETVLIGGEASFGVHAATPPPREVVLKLVADHPTQQGAALFAREQWAAISGMAVGTSINLATAVQPMTGLIQFLYAKEAIAPTLHISGTQTALPPAKGVAAPPPPAPQRTIALPETPGTLEVNLLQLAYARSGDKGHLFNVAVIARRAEYLPYLKAALTAEAVAEWYRHLGPDGTRPRVDVYEAPGLNALNFVINDALAGGINANTRLDPAAKGMAQMLLRFPVPVSAAIAATLSNAHPIEEV